MAQSLMSESICMEMNSFKICTHMTNEFILLINNTNSPRQRNRQILNEFIYYLKPYNKWIQLLCKTNELTLPNEFACNPSLTAEVLINFMRESQMLPSSSLTLGCSKNKFTTRQRADLTSLGKTWSQKEPDFLPCLVLNSSFPMWRVFPVLFFMSSQESAWYMRKKSCSDFKINMRRKKITI